jgi:hypothetical protein
MPKKAKEVTYFDAINYWNIEYAPFQKKISQVIHSPDTSIVHLLCTTQVGKSFIAYRDLMLEITKGYNKLPNEERMKDKLFFTIIPLDNELDKFFGEQFLKPFGKDKNGNIPTNIDNIRIPIMQEDGTWKLTKIVKRFNRNGVPVIEFFNNCKCFFFAADANPEKHLPGYTFYKGVYDEYAKFKGDITHIVSDRLMREKGTLLTVTTLNENDYNNWYTQDIYRHYKNNGTLIIPNKESDLCGLEIYKIESNEEIELDRIDKNGNLSKEKVKNKNKSFLIIGDLEKIYPYAHDGENIYLRVRNHIKQGIKDEDYYQAIHRCNPNVHTNLRILSNYNAENNQLDIIGRVKEIDELFPYQAIGFDPGKAGGGRYDSNVGWARVGMRLDPEKPKYEQFCILDSGILNMQDAYLDNLIPFLLNFNLPIFTDNSIWKVTNNTSEGKICPVDEYFRIAKQLGRLIEAKANFKPAGGENRRNDSSQRSAFWQQGLSVFKNAEEASIYLQNKRLPFNINEYTQYYRPFTDEPGSQILIATDKYNISLNARLIFEIENWKKSYDKEGNIKEMGSNKAKIDCWDATSLGVSGLQVHRKFLEGKIQAKKKVNAGLYDMPVRQNFIALNDLARYHGYKTF